MSFGREKILLHSVGAGDELRRRSTTGSEESLEFFELLSHRAIFFGR